MITQIKDTKVTELELNFFCTEHTRIVQSICVYIIY